MGGNFEGTIGGQQTPATSPQGDVLQRSSVEVIDLPKMPKQKQSIRYHQNGKNVHFHADDDKLKVSMPLVQCQLYFEALRNLSAREKLYYDSANGTLATFTVGQENDSIDICIKITPCSEGEVMQKLGQFFDSVSKK